jgi:hypothetical protein
MQVPVANTAKILAQEIIIGIIREEITEIIITGTTSLKKDINPGN